MRSVVKQKIEQLKKLIEKFEDKKANATGGQEVEIQMAINNATSELRSLERLIN